MTNVHTISEGESDKKTELGPGEEEISHVGPVQLFGGETKEFQNCFT